MEYGSEICGIFDGDQVKDAYNDQKIKLVGWSDDQSVCMQEYFSKSTLESLYYRISELLKGVDPYGRNIVVPMKTINHVMNQVYSAYRPPTSDIYGRYNVTSAVPSNYVEDMINQTIEIIVSDVKNNLGMQYCNEKLTAWTTVLGDFNESGLRSHGPIKIREKNSNNRGFVSFMNY